MQIAESSHHLPARDSWPLQNLLFQFVPNLSHLFRIELLHSTNAIISLPMLSKETLSRRGNKIPTPPFSRGLSPVETHLGDSCNLRRRMERVDRFSRVKIEPIALRESLVI